MFRRKYGSIDKISSWLDPCVVCVVGGEKNSIDSAVTLLLIRMRALTRFLQATVKTHRGIMQEGIWCYSISIMQTQYVQENHSHPTKS